jgi:hypothetical protein
MKYKLMVAGKHAGTLDSMDMAVSVMLGKHASYRKDGSIVVPTFTLEPIEEGADAVFDKDGKPLQAALAPQAEEDAVA